MKNSSGYWLSIFAAGLFLQVSLLIGFTFCLGWSLFYFFLHSPMYPQENPLPFLVGIGLSSFCFFLGKYVLKSRELPFDWSLKRGFLIVLLTWLVACSISAVVFMLFGFPDPVRAAGFSVFRRFVDGFFESMSGFTTSGDSILAHVQIFPRSILMWRSVSIWIGGMGIAYFALTVMKSFSLKREEVMNGEAESPDKSAFPSQELARESGLEFLRAYLVLSALLIGLLVLAGSFFRATPYQAFHENLYDAFIHTGSVMGTGGFSNYDNSVAGLQNPVSEWIIAFFMIIGGANFALLYTLFIQGNLKDIWANKEWQYYLGVILVITMGIWGALVRTGTYRDNWASLRHAFFAVSTIISTTGLATQDFALWPAQAVGLLFICYLIGSCVGSTGGGLKIKRFMIITKYMWAELKNMISNERQETFLVDGTTYTLRDGGIVTLNMFLYYFLFLVGGILLMWASRVATFPDGSTKNIDFTSAFTASLASLGNIGPAVVKGNIDAGPAGNYFAFSVAGKIVMIMLMFVGRVGVLNVCLGFVPEKKK